MKSKSWKTTTTGIVMIVSGAASLFFAGRAGKLDEGTITGSVTAILGGFGLLCAKDHNVSGNPPKTIQPK